MGGAAPLAILALIQSRNSGRPAARGVVAPHAAAAS